MSETFNLDSFTHKLILLLRLSRSAKISRFWNEIADDECAFQRNKRHVLRAKAQKNSPRSRVQVSDEKLKNFRFEQVYWAISIWFPNFAKHFYLDLMINCSCSTSEYKFTSFRSSSNAIYLHSKRILYDLWAVLYSPIQSTFLVKPITYCWSYVVSQNTHAN